MPSIELEGHSEAKFMLVDGKIVRVEAPAANPPMQGPGQGPTFDMGDRRMRE